MKQSVFIMVCLSGMCLFGHAENKSETINEGEGVAAADTSRVVDLEEAVVVASPKQTDKLRNQAVSSTVMVSGENMPPGSPTLNDISGCAANFIMPAYGSSQSAAIYIRGVGSRLNTPAVGLYVDNVPTVERSAYSFNLLGVNRIDVLRGPQATLYGRNAMGGLIRLYTINPLRRQGTDIATGFSSRDARWYGSVNTNQKLNDRTGLSLGAYYDGNHGTWRNVTTKERTGGKTQGGVRGRLVYQKDRWNFDFTASYEHTDEDAYPYFYDGTVSGPEALPEAIGQITANRNSSYRRHLLNTGLTAAYTAPLFTVSSVTGYQLLADRMVMDQDFLALDYYTLKQKQNANTLTEEIVLKSLAGKRWEWTGGLYGMWEAMRTHGPVRFYEDGVGMINSNIASHIPTPSITIVNPRTGRPVTQSMPMYLQLTDASFEVPGYFRAPVLGGAAFFQNTLHDCLIPRLGLTLGLRLDYEHQQFHYVSGGPVDYHFSMPTHSVSADMATTTVLRGNLRNDYTHLLPKAAVQYDFPRGKGNVYLSVSKGLRAGGYNGQMFSDLMNTVMQNDMMTGVRDYCYDVMTQHAERIPAMKDMFLSIRQAIVDNIPLTELPSVSETVTYKPEYCWNYEAGAHLNLFDNALAADVSVFYTDTHDQQIARFSPSGLGRMMVNAGQSHTCGAEVALNSRLFDNRLSLSANYGYTHAIFYRYNAGNGIDYTDNRVPFIPEHTMGIMADFCQPVSGSFLNAITIGANASGFGRMYWTESNAACQNFYAVMGAHMALDFGKVSIDLWGKNLNQRSYKTFYFESMNRGFYQKGMPMQLGVDLRFRL